MHGDEPGKTVRGCMASASGTGIKNTGMDAGGGIGRGDKEQTNLVDVIYQCPLTRVMS